LSRPFLLVQISDLHLGERPRDGADPEGCLRAVVKALKRLPDRPDAVLVSGDLAEHAKPREYRLAAKLIGKLGVPLFGLPGNHDDRATMREVLGLGDPEAGGAPLDYTVDLGPLRLIVVDSTIPGEDRGGFEPGQLERLDAQLGAASTPAIVAMHHPPLTTTMADWDGVNLPVPEREALAAVVSRHPQAKAIVAGHLHRVTASALAGRPVLAAPSTYLQARPDFGAEKVKLYAGAPGFVVHALRGGELSSQIEIVTRG
jgi:3',5'-cyclic AMP phosphodiesterase CpdA